MIRIKALAIGASFVFSVASAHADAPPRWLTSAKCW